MYGWVVGSGSWADGGSWAGGCAGVQPHIHLLARVRCHHLHRSTASRFPTPCSLRFSTYATIWIRSSIARCVRQDSSGGSVVVPQKVLALKDRINKYRRSCMVEKGYMIEPSREEIATALKVPLEKVQQCMNRAYGTGELESTS